MSFGDISKGSWGSTAAQERPALKGDQISEIGTALANLQSECLKTKDTLTVMRKKRIGPSEKNELSMKIKNLRDLESNLKIKLDAENQKLESIPRSEAASKRSALSKLSKDFNRVQDNIGMILNESTLVKVVNERGEVESFARTSSAANSAPSSAPSSSKSITGGSGSSVNAVYGSYGGSGSQTGGGGGYAEEPPPVPMSRKEQKLHTQQMKLQPMLQGQEVDDAIMEEREQAIKKINQDLILVNEMFQDMAVLVEKQNEPIKAIAEAADNAHQRTKEGLVQVNKAAEYQPGCVLC